MRSRWAVLIVVTCAALTWCLAAFLMNIAERKREGRRLEECPCAAVTCPHPSRVVK